MFFVTALVLLFNINYRITYLLVVTGKLRMENGNSFSLGDISVATLEDSGFQTNVEKVPNLSRQDQLVFQSQSKINAYIQTFHNVIRY